MSGKLSRHAIVAWLKRRFLLRLHMFWIVTGTFLAGLLASRILMALRVDHLAIRYAIAVVAGYLTFLVLIRLWLWYVGVRAQWQLDPDPEAVDFLSHLSFDPPAGGADLAGVDLAGGAFGGGGATGSWEATPDVSWSPPASIQPSGASPSGPSGCGFDLDLDAAVVIVAFVTALLTLFIAGGYVIYAAPSILADAAVEAALAAVLARRAKKIDRPTWVGSLLAATLVPAFAVLLFSVIFGAVVEHYCPEANRLRDVVHCLGR